MIVTFLNPQHLRLNGGTSPNNQLDNIHYSFNTDINFDYFSNFCDILYLSFIYTEQTFAVLVKVRETL